MTAFQNKTQQQLGEYKHIQYTIRYCVPDVYWHPGIQRSRMTWPEPINWNWTRTNAGVKILDKDTKAIIKTISCDQKVKYKQMLCKKKD